MVGQGSPQHQTFAHSLLQHALLICIGCCAVLLSRCALQAAEPDLRVRVSWGGGTAHSWQGRITLSEGQILECKPLGFEPDTPGSMQRSGTAEVVVAPRIPRTFEGCDLSLTAPLEAKLIIELQHERSERAQKFEVPLAQAFKTVQRIELDKEGNRLVVARPPGDQLRVTLPREALIFSPAERLALEVQTQGLELTTGSLYTLQTAIFNARTETEINATLREFRGEGATPVAVPITIDLPIAEGVYDVRLSVAPKRLGQSLAPQLARLNPLAERRVQVVVVDPNRPQLKTTPSWQTEMEIDPAHPKWWERLKLVPSFKLLPGLPGEPLGSVKPATRSHLGRTLVELPSQAWQAYPLAVSRPGEPHVIELEYPSDLKQTLSLSLLEPDAQGKVGASLVDSGLDVAEPAPGHKPGLVKHRLICWPQTRSPLLLLVNRRGDGPAVYGRIKLLSGMSELDALATPAVENGRRLVAYYDRPYFAQQFSAGEASGPSRTLEDWVTFYHGGRRLVEYLKHTGYTAAVIPAASRGSALYPSALLEPSSEQDGGVLLESGQDPHRKDALELLFLLFDRAGLKLMPSLNFATPLPALERLRLAEGDDAIGLEPIGADGRSALLKHGTRTGLAAYYNPLDPRVQQAVRNVVQELTERYQHHPSFGGVCLASGPESFLWLPDDVSSCDDVTIRRFSAETGATVPGEGAERFAARARYLRGEGSPTWLKWRSSQLTTWLTALQRDVTAQNPQAEVCLAVNDLLSHRQLQAVMRPNLGGPTSAALPLIQIGLDAPGLTAAGLMLLRPQRVAAQVPPDGVSLFTHANQSTELDRLLGGTRAALVQHEQLPLAVPEFDRVSPFGRDRTKVQTAPQLASAGSDFRREFVHSLARLDARVLLGGGAMLPLGQEESLRSLAEVYRRLPVEPFAAVEPADPRQRTQPVVLRTLKQSGKLLFYAVNDAPWPVLLEIDFAGAGSARTELYNQGRKPAVQRTAGGFNWQMRLEPYDLVGGEVAAGDASIAAWRVSTEQTVELALRERVRDSRLRTNALRTPRPIEVLPNAGFEAPSDRSETPGWVHAQGRGITVQVSSDGYKSPHSLHVASQRGEDGQTPIVWIRSEPFDPPTTGRMSIVAWLRVNDPAKQPKLRLAVEGKWDGKPYYRRANVGASEDGRPVKPLTKNWAPYRFPLNDLPPAKLTDLRVGIDLMDEGELWMDDMQVYDLWFEDQERDELLKNIATADVQLDAGRYGDCQRFLEGYWPWYLKQFVPLDAPVVATQPPATNAATPAKTPANNNIFDKVRGALPPLPKWPLK